MHLLFMPLPYDLPFCPILFIHGASYLKRNEDTVPAKNSACIVVLQTIQFEITYISKALLKRALQNYVQIFLQYLPYPLYLLYHLLLLSFLPQETLYLRASSDRITKRYRYG